MNKYGFTIAPFFRSEAGYNTAKSVHSEGENRVAKTTKTIQRSKHDSLGERIRKARIHRKMTIEKASQAAGITKGFLSNVERGAKTPGISTLLRIASALKVGVSLLLTTNHPQGHISLTNVRTPGHFLKASAMGYKFTPLARGTKPRFLEPFLVSIPPKLLHSPHELQHLEGDSIEGVQHTGEEFVMVLSGKILHVIGDKEFVLKRGDAVYFDPTVPHWARSLTGKDSKVLVVMFSGFR
jgi:transcriptional regulator with XRE-family HTH domain